MIQDRDIVELTRYLVGINTINPPGDEDAIMLKIASYLEQHGFKVALHRISESRSNLVATLLDQGEGLPLVLTGHIDTVPLGDIDWSFDPFSGRNRRRQALRPGHHGYEKAASRR